MAGLVHEAPVPSTGRPVLLCLPCRLPKAAAARTLPTRKTSNRGPWGLLTGNRQPAKLQRQGSKASGRGLKDLPPSGCEQLHPQSQDLISAVSGWVGAAAVAESVHLQMFARQSRRLFSAVTLLGLKHLKGKALKFQSYQARNTSRFPHNRWHTQPSAEKERCGGAMLTTTKA